MARGTIHQLIEVFIEAFRGLGVCCDCADIERLAVMIHRIMSYQSRQFHTLEHVFGFLEGADHVTALAAAFHDLVYYQVDDGLPPDLAELLDPYLDIAGSEIRLAAAPISGDLAYEDCLAIFGFEAGQAIPPFGGLNEFLSALVMAKSLEPHLPRATVAALSTAIEASIPFRGASADGRGMAEALEERLGRLASGGGLAMSDEAIGAAVDRAVAFANVDVKDFAAPDPGYFLSNTWKLLPESNAPLRRRGAFSIGDYRVALLKMQGFFRSLRPEAIYHAYRARPDATEMARLAEASRRNLEYAQAYIQAKLLAAALLEATAEVSGGDAPMALFMGDLPQAEEGGDTLTAYLPSLPAPPWISTDNIVYRLLKDGRLDESSFDLKNSPLALYLYHRLPPNVWGGRSRAAGEFFSGALSAEAYLMGFDPDFRAEFLGACAAMVPTRRAVLQSWLKSHPGP